MDQPNIQAGELSRTATGPGRTVVTQNRVRQTIPSKGLNQTIRYRLGALIVTRLQNHVVAGMVIHRTERMASTPTQGKMALEIHLPKLIGSTAFKTLERFRRPTLL